MMASKAPNNGNAPGAESDERKARLNELVDRLHKKPTVFADESIAPEVDRNVLLMLARGELPEEQARLVYRLVHTFKSWCEAHVEVLTEELSKKKQ